MKYQGRIKKYNFNYGGGSGSDDPWNREEQQLLAEGNSPCDSPIVLKSKRQPKQFEPINNGASVLKLQSMEYIQEDI